MLAELGVVKAAQAPEVAWRTAAYQQSESEDSGEDDEESGSEI